MTRLDYKSLLGPILVWLCVVVAGLIGGLLSDQTLGNLYPGAILMAVPAILSLIFLPFIRRAWAQAIVLLIWTGFGIVATLVAGLLPQAICFLAVPAIGMVFAKERIIEGVILATIGIMGSLVSIAYIGADASPLAAAERSYLSIISVGATLALTVAAMIGGTHRRLRDFSFSDVPDDVAYGGQAQVGQAQAAAFSPSYRVAHDVTEPPLARNIASQAGADLREIVSGALLEFSPDGTLVNANRRAQLLLGPFNTAEGVTVSRLAERTNRPDVMRQAAASARRSRSPTEVRLTMALNDAPQADVDMRFAVANNHRLVLHMTDRTDEMARIEALQRAHIIAEREAQDKTLFFAGVSHELRTPLNAIIGFSDMMRSRLFGPLPGKYAEYADLIHDSGHYMLDLIGDVLDLSKVEAGKYQLTLDTFDMSDVVRSSVKMVRPAADAAEICMDVILGGDDPHLITADRKALRQILLNLLSNAIKFSPKGSRIEVQTADQDGEMVLVVRDQGDGMSQEELERIGQPFAQGASGQNSEARGSGLGLSLVRSLTELHGGTLTIQSAENEGTIARVAVPANPDMNR